MSNEKTLIRKALEENQGKLDSLAEKEGKLVEQEQKLISTLEPEEKIQARVNVIKRKIDDALVQGGNANELKAEIAEIEKHSREVKDGIRKVGEAIEAVRAERGKLVKEIIYQVHPQIKETFALMLQATVTWIEHEVTEYEEVVSENGVTLPPSFFKELMIFREGSRGGSRDWRPLRDKLDKWLP